MKRRRLVEAEIARLLEENRRMRSVIEDQEHRLFLMKAERDQAVTERARAEAARNPGMCRDLATCVATCSAAAHWRNQQREAS